jgi:hypothetical protein
VSERHPEGGLTQRVSAEHTLTILVVEDDNAIAELTHTVLAQKGF